jgi:hypothetical protein
MDLVNKAIMTQPTPKSSEPNGAGKSRKEANKPGVYNKITENIKSFTDIITEPRSCNNTQIPAQSLHIPSTIPSASLPASKSNPPPKPNPSPNLNGAKQKLKQIRENRRKGILTCYRCRESPFSGLSKHHSLFRLWKAQPPFMKLSIDHNKTYHSKSVRSKTKKPLTPSPYTISQTSHN